MKPCILEVQKFIDDVESSDKGKFKHVGYINRIFKNKEQACKFYDEKNLHMRKINSHNTYCSDWDPDTKLRYIIRIYYGELLTL